MADEKKKQKPKPKPKKAKKPKKGDASEAPAEDAAPPPPPRLLERFRAEIVPKLGAELGIPNAMAVPRPKKIVLNMGVGDAHKNKSKLEAVMRDLAIVSGQRPIVTKARKSVASFHLRDGMVIGCKVTLRGKRMWEFIDRLISLAIPRIRDFRGLNPKSFDGRGNYSMGLTEQILFPEINIDSIQHEQGMDVTVVMSGGSDEHSRGVLRALGFPFRTADQKN